MWKIDKKSATASQILAVASGKSDLKASYELYMFVVS